MSKVPVSTYSPTSFPMSVYSLKISSIESNSFFISDMPWRCSLLGPGTRAAKAQMKKDVNSGDGTASLEEGQAHSNELYATPVPAAVLAKSGGAPPPPPGAVHLGTFPSQEAFKAAWCRAQADEVFRCGLACLIIHKPPNNSRHFTLCYCVDSDPSSACSQQVSRLWFLSTTTRCKDE